RRGRKRALKEKKKRPPRQYSAAAFYMALHSGAPSAEIRKREITLAGIRQKSNDDFTGAFGTECDPAGSQRRGAGRNAYENSLLPAKRAAFRICVVGGYGNDFVADCGVQDFRNKACA
ncbi:MAG TPA: hypothetical protein DEF06_09660, partial [Clostridiales bacterium]|nr:hypothetical protein [Clostridiales bacterium]